MSQLGEPWTAGESTTNAPCTNASIKIWDHTAHLEISSVDAYILGIGADGLVDRIVACVNFCRQFPTEFLEKNQLEFVVVGDGYGSPLDADLRARYPKYSGLHITTRNQSK